jgi:hypothetical protein
MKLKVKIGMKDNSCGQCCGSGKFIPDPGSRIPNTKICRPICFCSLKFYIIENFLFLNR